MSIESDEYLEAAEAKILELATKEYIENIENNPWKVLN